VTDLRCLDLTVNTELYLDPEQEVVERFFIKKESVFKLWIRDFPPSLDEACKIDMGYWKVPRFIREPEDVEAVNEVCLKYFPQLKNIFVSLMSNDAAYPNVGWLAFGKFADSVKMPDKFCKMSDIDRLFIVVNFEVDDNMEDNPDKELCRYEFLEILVRIAD